MVSRVALLAALACAGIALGAADARTPRSGTAIFVTRADARLCASTRCGGYRVALANGVRTTCADGRRRGWCYAAIAVGRNGGRLGRLEDGSLVRGVLAFGRDDLGALRVHALYVPAGAAAANGGFYRVVDNGIRCVRSPCFSTTARSVNASTRVSVSSVDLRGSGASAAELRRAEAALATKNGLYARGRFAPTPDGGRVFRALRLYLRAPLPPA